MAETSVPLDVFQDVIAREISRHPEQRSRIERAAKLIATNRVHHLAFDMRLVASETDPSVEYIVDATGCPCEDAKRHPEFTCKHRWSVDLLLVAEERTRRLAERATAPAALTVDARTYLAELIVQRQRRGRIVAAEGGRAVEDAECVKLDEHIARLRANLAPVSFREAVAA
jgi:hypothetical protein